MCESMNLGINIQTGTVRWIFLYFMINVLYVNDHSPQILVFFILRPIDKFQR